MSVSTTLLVVALGCAVFPILSTGLRPPSTIRELEKSLVVGSATLFVGVLVTYQLHSLSIFGWIHILYLLVVVTMPALLIGWWALAAFRQMRSPLVSIGGLVGVGLVLAGTWATHIEPNWLRVDRVSAVANIEAPITIGVLADMQTPNVGKHEHNAIDALVEADPDLVVVPGDYFQGNGIEIQAQAGDFVGLLQTLVDAVGLVVVVSGDSDHAPLLRSMSDAAGATFLDNGVIDATVAGQPMRIAGIAVADSPARLDTIAALGTPTEAFTLLVSHRPGAVFDLPLNTDVDLIVAGHTHGGQVSIPGYGPPITLSDVPREIAAGGIGLVDNFVVYVSTGVGLERNDAPQIRFGVRPSVGIIELQPADN